MSADPTLIPRLIRLIRWLSLPYGQNVPIFHGANKDELERTYFLALSDDWDDGDPSYWVAAQWATSRPVPSPDQDWGDQHVDLVTIDERGNTVR